MHEIDRSLIIVRPKQPFFDWVQTVDYDAMMTLEDVRDDPSAYLVPELWSNSEQAELLTWSYEDIFEAELNSWYTDPTLWPTSRDLKSFLEWFDVEFHSGVFDLSDDPIEIVNYGSEDNIESGSNGN